MSKLQPARYLAKGKVKFQENKSSNVSVEFEIKLNFREFRQGESYCLLQDYQAVREFYSEKGLICPYTTQDQLDKSLEYCLPEKSLPQKSSLLGKIEKKVLDTISFDHKKLKVPKLILKGGYKFATHSVSFLYFKLETIFKSCYEILEDSLRAFIFSNVPEDYKDGQYFEVGSSPHEVPDYVRSSLKVVDTFEVNTSSNYSRDSDIKGFIRQIETLDKEMEAKGIGYGNVFDEKIDKGVHLEKLGLFASAKSFLLEFIEGEELEDDEEVYEDQDKPQEIGTHSEKLGLLEKAKGLVEWMGKRQVKNALGGIICFGLTFQGLTAVGNIIEVQKQRDDAMIAKITGLGQEINNMKGEIKEMKKNP